MIPQIVTPGSHPSGELVVKVILSHFVRKSFLQVEICRSQPLKRVSDKCEGHQQLLGVGQRHVGGFVEHGLFEKATCKPCRLKKGSPPGTQGWPLQTSESVQMVQPCSAPDLKYVHQYFDQNNTTYLNQYKIPIGPTSRKVFSETKRPMQLYDVPADSA